MQRKRELIFITKRNYDQKEFSKYNIKITNDLTGLYKLLANSKWLAFDTENSSLDPFKAIPLLESIGNGVESFVIDKTTITENYLDGYTNILFIGHNMQYDYVIKKQTQNVELRKVYDTMITEQILGRGSGRSNSLEATHLRRLGYEMLEDKATRNGFINRTINTTFTPKEVSYSGYDVECLPKIVKAQLPLIDKYKLNYRIKVIGFGLIPILADMYLEGMTLNREAWLSRIQEDKIKKFEVELKLDSILEKLSKEHSSIRNGKFTRERRRQELIIKDIWGDIVSTASNENVGNINYGSSNQVLDIFKRLKLKLPTTTDLKTYETIISVGEKALESYLIENPDTILYDFCKLLIKHAKLSKAIDSFGEIFLHEFYKPSGKGKKVKKGYYKEITKKIHTRYSQETTANGRLTSGDAKELAMKVGVYNSQQIPKEKRYRVCFTLTQEEIDNDWWITTCDLSGAELVILGALSGDRKLIDLLLNKDVHSHLATASFNKIIDYMLNTFKGKRLYDELYELLQVNKIYKSKSYAKELKDKKGNIIGNMTHSLAGEPLTAEDCHKLTDYRVKSVLKHKKFIVNKNTSKDIRDPYKNVVYGSTYGAQASKIGTTLGIAKLYSELVVKSMYEELPEAFNYLDRMSDYGVKNGYIIFNDITNSRHWFKDILDARKYRQEIDYKVKGRVSRQCKNLPISGTQADMIKEAMVEIDNFGRKNNYEFKFLLQVHDELVIKHKGRDFSNYIPQIMSNSANRYLNGITKMKATVEIGHTWTK